MRGRLLLTLCYATDSRVDCAHAYGLWFYAAGLWFPAENFLAYTDYSACSSLMRFCTHSASRFWIQNWYCHARSFEKAREQRQHIVNAELQSLTKDNQKYLAVTWIESLEFVICISITWKLAEISLLLILSVLLNQALTCSSFFVTRLFCTYELS